MIETLQNVLREPGNALTHLLGTLFALIALILLLQKSIHLASVPHTIAFTVFGISMVLVYVASTLFHGLRVDEKTEQLLRTLDHSMVYLLIAGSYTPLCMLVLNETFGRIMLISVWILAVVGIVQKFLWASIPRWISLSFYLGMGWIGITFLPEIYQTQSIRFLGWLVVGGASYSVGAIIYGVKKPDPYPGWFGFHEIWHIFVMIGSFTHFWAFYQHL